MNNGSRVGLVTGASSGIGRAIASLLLDSGYRVAALSRTAGPEGVAHFPCDVREPEQVRAVVTRVESEIGAVDVAVINAGRGLYKGFAEASFEEIEDVYRTNVIGAAATAHAVLPSMLQRRSGHLIFIGSIAAQL